MKNWYNKLFLNNVRRAVENFDLIDNGDTLVLGISGGKDSMTMCYIMSQLRIRSNLSFDMVAVHVESGLNNEQIASIREFLKLYSISFLVLSSDLPKIMSRDKANCSLCASVRKGIIKSFCLDNKYKKIVFAHHLDDFAETFYLNLFYGNQIKNMKVKNTDSIDEISIIRPLAYVDESSIVKVCSLESIPFFPSNCRHNDCTKRYEIKNWIKNQSKELGIDIRHSIMRATDSFRLTRISL